MTIHIDGCFREFKAGDPPPDPNNYFEWYEWSEVQLNAGLEQSLCCMCCKWFWPQELSETIFESVHNTKKNGKGKDVVVKSRKCLSCDTARRV